MIHVSLSAFKFQFFLANSEIILGMILLKIFSVESWNLQKMRLQLHIYMAKTCLNVSHDQILKDNLLYDNCKYELVIMILYNF